MRNPVASSAPGVVLNQPSFFQNRTWLASDESDALFGKDKKPD
jgi:hypothetical protein